MLHRLQVEHAEIQTRIVRQKKQIRQIRIRLGMDAAELARVERQLAEAGIQFQPVRPASTEE